MQLNWNCGRLSQVVADSVHSARCNRMCSTAHQYLHWLTATNARDKVICCQINLWIAPGPWIGIIGEDVNVLVWQFEHNAAGSNIATKTIHLPFYLKQGPINHSG
jgi:hypothetical protein